LLPIFKLGLGSGVGTGKQHMPWIHIDDLISLFYEMLFNPAYNGIYNAVATEHATNYSFSKQLAQALHRPFFMPLVPAAVLKWIYGEMANVILEGSRVSNDRLLKQGFVLKYPDLKSALKALCK
jgi:NAD dependent epimerase/dehydratase family enzyme